MPGCSVLTDGEHHIIGKTIEMQGLHKNGRFIPVELSLSEWESSGKKFYTSIMRDISGRLLAEEKIKKLLLGVEQSPASIIITDSESNIEYVNKKFISVTGYSSAEVIGKNTRILKSGENDPKIYEELWSNIKAGKEWRGELCNRKKSGDRYWEAVLISPLISNDGNITNFIALKEDITEQKKLMKELIEAKDKAEETNRLKSNFLANMSHELRTPLIGILGYAEIIQEKMKDTVYFEMVNTILNSGRRLKETLNLLLDLSYIESNKTEIRMEVIDIKDNINETVKLFKASAEKKNLSIITVFPDEPVSAKLDDKLFSQIMNNLLNNAIKFTNSGGVSIAVSNQANNEYNFVKIQVRDTGIGIPEEKIDIIFEEFEQVSEGYGREFEGTGLGLTLVKKFTELMGGKVGVESEYGKGTVFMLEFPQKI